MKSEQFVYDSNRDRRGHDRLVAGSTTTCTIRVLFISGNSGVVLYYWKFTYKTSSSIKWKHISIIKEEKEENDLPDIIKINKTGVYTPPIF
jgi:hypothetical protein